MGEISDLIIEGEVCQLCMCEMGNAVGYPRTCKECAAPDPKQKASSFYSQVPKGSIRCTTCKRVVKAVGLAQHNRDRHGVKT